jgi:6-phosphogluconolactonase
MTALRLLPVAYAVLFTSPALAAEPAFKVYAPSRQAKQLLVFAATPIDAGLDLVAEKPFDLSVGPGPITVHPTKPLLYVLGSGGRPHAVKSAVLTLDATGAVAQATPFDAELGSVHARIDAAGRFLFTADYGTGAVDVYPLDDAGMPGRRCESRDEARRMAHCTVVSPDGRFVYVPHVKQFNALFQYALDRDTVKLAPLDPADVGPAADTGPRHGVCHPTLPVIYFSNEQQLGVSVYTRAADGRLTLAEVCECADPAIARTRKAMSASDIVVTPDGRFVFSGLRGHGVGGDAVVRYAAGPDGRLTFLGCTPADDIPWGFALSPGGDYLLVTASDGATITAYRIGPDGDLAKAASVPCGKQVTSVVAR